MEPLARPKFVVRKHPEFKRFYSSGVFGGHTPYEFKMIVYQEGYEDVTEGTVTGKEPPVILRELQAEITMSPEQAKALLSWLDRHIKAYEQQFGKIPSPPPVLEEPVRQQEGMYG
jgi:ABC-type Fe3+-hydroxamate transport system substrate-binding protein